MLIEKTTKQIYTVSGCPDTNWMPLPDEDFYILHDQSELAQKALEWFPNFRIILSEDGKEIADIVQDDGQTAIAIWQDQKQEENKAACAKFLQENPILWQDGKYYGVSQDDQNEMSLNLMQYQLALASGIESPLLWHAKREECRVFTAEEFTALTLAISAYIYPYMRYENRIKAEIYQAQSKEELEGIVIDYENMA